ncbi:Os10g0418900 [Oryza sativa Japonica Group]|uniref:Uncharacterized protein n=7 Tax=Oryza TaxID=4527 RepID=A0A8J8YAA9_ORYSJ|nr:hypothetical protein OsI_33597 [Oryza sativa Indica Group]EEE50967.1 hypothetical protein OsJ_31539 [Oryza sativa Japonica Group]KAB8112769.1 hypothetical protein EE612_051480 [Oryza sativa]KAF2913609.1 hypothetical protein DAI22_10g098300 [Oryza sativa Japonica Group]BAT10871.1 Os10g0418900 [Oryza sativa Japonica Group]
MASSATSGRVLAIMLLMAIIAALMIINSPVAECRVAPDQVGVDPNGHCYFDPSSCRSPGAP